MKIVEPEAKSLIFVGPLLPHFAERPDLLDQLFGRLVDVGVREVYIEHINLKQYIRERMNLVLAEEEPQVREAYVRARAKEHRELSTQSSPNYWASTASSSALRKSFSTTSSRPSMGNEVETQRADQRLATHPGQVWSK